MRTHITKFLTGVSRRQTHLFASIRTMNEWMNVSVVRCPVHHHEPSPSQTATSRNIDVMSSMNFCRCRNPISVMEECASWKKCFSKKTIAIGDTYYISIPEVWSWINAYSEYESGPRSEAFFPLSIFADQRGRRKFTSGLCPMKTTNKIATTKTSFAALCNAFGGRAPSLFIARSSNSF